MSDWICYGFPRARAAYNFVDDLAAGYRQQGISYCDAGDSRSGKRAAIGWPFCRQVTRSPLTNWPAFTLASDWSGSRST